MLHQMKMNTEQREYEMAYGNEEVSHLHNPAWTFYKKLLIKYFKIVWMLLKTYCCPQMWKSLFGQQVVAYFQEPTCILVLPRQQATLSYYRLQYIYSLPDPASAIFSNKSNHQGNL